MFARISGRKADPTLPVTKDNDLQSSFPLQRLYRSFKFKNADPKVKQQKAVPPCVVAKACEMPSEKKYFVYQMYLRRQLAVFRTKFQAGDFDHEYPCY